MFKLNLQFDKEIAAIDDGPAKSVIAALEKSSIELPDNAVINAKVVSQAKVRALNKHYSGKDAATDVLSFNYAEDHPKAGKELGDVVIASQKVASQAKTAGTDEATELALLLLHGVMHILGYDHQSPEEVEYLDNLQKQLMESAGLKYRNFGWKK